ncbi:hypothetical protein OKA05_00915 [Luteolibacter arcticus]|uniref:Uncharacterized protein n=1 Tax=Luteolibacter arcticus TaxID=1581411 RepID=A0ABT3GBU5_9BACT|nr:hypothetical protein [Luteolibacter arcticus]MCW1921092.1 hypothetical protein [Luteolibacter arcticus]
MTEILAPLLRFAGAGLIVLAFLHLPMGRRLLWKEDAARMSVLNAAVFHVHTFFICLAVLLMGVPCLLDPGVLLEKSRAGLWGSWSLCLFWLCRLWCQWFVYLPSWWKGLRFETAMHWVFTGIWLFLTVLFGLCGAIQSGWTS